MIEFWEKIHLNGQQAMHFDLYTQVVKGIKERQLGIGDKLPTEESLSLQLGVSKAVVRNAYHNLIKNEWVRRIPKKGLIVYPNLTSTTFSTKLQSVGYDIEETGSKANVVFIEKEILVNKNLNCFSKEEKLLHIKRLFKADSFPIFVMDSYYSLNRFPKLEHLDYENLEFFKYIETNYQIKVKNIKRTFKPILMPKEFAQILMTTPDTACFRVNSRALDQEGFCIEYAISHSIGDQFSIELA